MVSNSRERTSTFSTTGMTKVPPPLTMRKPRLWDGAVRLDKPVLAAGDDQHLVGADLGVAAGPDHQKEKDDEDQTDGASDDPAAEGD